MDLRRFSVRHVVYIRLHQNSQMSTEAMCHQLKILIELRYAPEKWMPMFHPSIVVQWQFLVNEVHDFHSEKKKTEN